MKAYTIFDQTPGCLMLGVYPYTCVTKGKVSKSTGEIGFTAYETLEDLVHNIGPIVDPKRRYYMVDLSGNITRLSKGKLVATELKPVKNVSLQSFKIVLEEDPRYIEMIPFELLTQDMVKTAVESNGAVIKYLPRVLITSQLLNMAKISYPAAAKLMKPHPYDD